MANGIKAQRIKLDSSLTLLAAAPAEKCPIVIILHEAFGLNSHWDDVVSHVASHGFFAVAPDLFAGRVIDYSDMPGAMEAVGACSDGRSMEIIKNAINWAHQQTQGVDQPVGLLGFCMGGRLAFIGACELGAQIEVAVCCYGGGIGAEGDTDRRGRAVPIARKDIASISAGLVFVYGNQDTHIPPAEHARIVSKLGEHQRPFALETYPAGHGFMSDRPAYYNPACAREAWHSIFAHLLRHMESLPGTSNADYQ
jgi:carboxymethylenebutenolidase